MEKVLIVVAHPDDEVLGMGATIFKHVSNGDEIHLVITTEGYTPPWSKEFIENMSKQMKKSSKILGIKKVYLLGFPTVKLDTIPQKELNDAISKVINDFKPDILYIPHKGDLNKDHRLIFEACLVASRPVNHKIKRILSCEVLSETEWGQAIEPFVPNLYVDIGKYINKKIEAFSAYKSEVREFPNPRSIEGIKSLARKRGSEVCLPYAEAFIIVREIL